MKFSKKFVCEDIAFSTYENPIAAPLFRKSFVLKHLPDSAAIRICGLGFYELYINGENITKGYLAPYISNSDHITYFDEYDLKPYLTVGENVIGVMLGDGNQVGKTCLWGINENLQNSAPLLALFAEIAVGDDVISFEADGFLCKKGPVIFNDLRSGIFYDARLYDENWCMAGADESDWHKPICGVYKPRGIAKLCEAEPIKAMREIKPVGIKEGSYKKRVWLPPEARDFLQTVKPFEKPAEYSGGYIYDFGENNTGLVRLKIRGERGQKVSLQFGEQIEDGELNCNNIYYYPEGFAQRDIYYLRGDGEEVFETKFTFHGFRYVYVSGITAEQATSDLLTFIVISSDMPKRGDFECSDEMSNKIFEIAHRSDVSNFLYFPMDCPHREKNGWTNDASASAEHMILTFGAEKSWREWINNIRAAQRQDGTLPGIVPTDSWGYDWGNGPASDRIVFYLPYYIYKFRGETQTITENASAMMRYLDYISRCRDEKGVIATGLGDWSAVERIDGGENSNPELGFTASVMIIDCCRKAVEMFRAVGLTLNAAYAEKLCDELLCAVRKEYLDYKTFVVRNRCQTSQAMAIFYDIFKADEKQAAFKALVDIIHEDGDSITSGFLGLRVVFHTLADFGEADLAYKMITKRDFPSYGYWVAKGETTLLEKFLQYDGYYPCSKNHHFFGDVKNWYIRCVGGINVLDSATVSIKPCFVKALSWAKASHSLPDGAVAVEWHRTENGVILTVKTDDNISCSVDVCGAVLQADGTYFIAD